MIVYIAGPMRNLPYYNFKEFDEAQVKLEALGHMVINPAQMDREAGFDAYKLPADSDWNAIPDGFSFDDCVTRDIEAVRRCDAVCLLKGWENSKGALAEKALAEWLGKTIIHQVSPYAAVKPCILPEDAKERKTYPMYRGLLKYFPDALLMVSNVSFKGNEQHHPGSEIHWDKTKSQDEPDALLRHMVEERWDQVAWRALANLQRHIDKGWRP